MKMALGNKVGSRKQTGKGGKPRKDLPPEHAHKTWLKGKYLC